MNECHMAMCYIQYSIAPEDPTCSMQYHDNGQTGGPNDISCAVYHVSSCPTAISEEERV